MFSHTLSTALVATALALAPALASATPFVQSGDAVDLPSGPGVAAPPYSLEVQFDWFMDQPDAPLTWTGKNWAFTLDPATLQSFRVLLLEGRHLVEPHAGEMAAGPIALGVLFPQQPGSGGTAFGTVQHSVNPNGHRDTWSMEVLVVSGGLANVKVRAFHPTSNGQLLPVPEPTVLALLGLSLVGVAAFRRRRT